jgi:hypothetical protein
MANQPSRPMSGTYAVPADNPPTPAYPSEWAQTPAAVNTPSSIIPHTAFDELQSWPGPSRLADGNYESTLDPPGGWGES